MLHAFAVTLSLFAAVPAEEKDLVPHLDDDTTIVRFSAVPEAYVGKGIYICGFLRERDHDNRQAFGRDI